MRVEWHGQAAFTLRGDQGTVVIDPFGDVSSMQARGIRWEYPPIQAPPADLVLVTHEHLDHNAVEIVPGEPAVIRSAAGRHESPLGEVVGIASEHDSAAGTERGANVIYVFSLDEIRVAHFGDFGQRELRPEQRQAIGEVDLVFLPAGGGPTIDGEAAAGIARELGAAWAVPMHYRTPRIGFLEDEGAFTAHILDHVRIGATSFDTGELTRRERPVGVIPQAP
jgi:L-ascorbate metabolism protein UlaG (beta-lactamase superfamily)